MARHEVGARCLMSDEGKARQGLYARRTQSRYVNTSPSKRASGRRRDSETATESETERLSRTGERAIRRGNRSGGWRHRTHAHPRFTLSLHHFCPSLFTVLSVVVAMWSMAGDESERLDTWCCCRLHADNPNMRSARGERDIHCLRRMCQGNPPQLPQRAHGGDLIEGEQR